MNDEVRVKSKLAELKLLGANCETCRFLINREDPLICGCKKNTPFWLGELMHEKVCELYESEK